MCAVYRYQVPTSMTQYVYDPMGRRVAKGPISTFNCDALTNGLNPTNEYVVGMGGEQLMETNGLYDALHSNFFLNGQLLATNNGSSWYYNLNDWLGTKRMQLGVTAASTVTVGEQCTSLPYGDGLNCTGSDVNHLYFTGKERDTESGNDYFLARYYSSNMGGRFLTPDWSKNPQGVPYANYTNPQTLNLYAYVGDNPLSLADADGHCTDTTNAPCELAEAAKKNSNAETSKAQQQVTASVQGKTVTYTYADGTQVTRSGTHPFRDNNPGDLTGGHGSIGRDAGFAIYGTPDAGWSALQATLTGKYADSTIAQTMNAFNPADNGKDPMLKGNDPVKYAATLAGAIGVPVSTKISALTPAQLSTVIANIGRAEGYYAHGNSVSQINPNQ